MKNIKGSALMNFDQNTLAKLIGMSFDGGVTEVVVEPKSSSLVVVSDPKHIIGEVNSIFWFGFNSSYEAGIEKMFWAPQELAQLEKSGCVFVKPADKSTARVYEWIKVFQQAKNTYLIAFAKTPQMETDYVHPSFDFVGPVEREAREQWLGKIQRDLQSSSLVYNATFTKSNVGKAHAPLQDWTVPTGLLAPDMNWSPSRVNTLLECPLRWHLETQKILSEGSDDYLNDERMALGNAGHKFFEEFFVAGYNVSSGFDSKLAMQKLSSALTDIQSFKLWSEIDVTNHKAQLLITAEVFHKFLNANALEVLENEAEKEKRYSASINLKGKIDIIIGQKGKPVLVVDFKSKVSPSLLKQLEQGSVQLSLYLEMIGQHDIAAGYFDLKKGILHYGGTGKFKNAKYYDIPKTRQITNETMQTVADTVVEINSGKLSATVVAAEDRLHKPYCNSCSYLGICGKKFEKYAVGAI